MLIVIPQAGRCLSLPHSSSGSGCLDGFPPPPLPATPPLQATPPLPATPRPCMGGPQAPVPSAYLYFPVSTSYCSHPALYFLPTLSLEPLKGRVVACSISSGKWPTRSMFLERIVVTGCPWEDSTVRILPPPLPRKESWGIHCKMRPSLLICKMWIASCSVKLHTRTPPGV